MAADLCVPLTERQNLLACIFVSRRYDKRISITTNQTRSHSQPRKHVATWFTLRHEWNSPLISVGIVYIYIFLGAVYCFILYHILSYIFSLMFYLIYSHSFYYGHKWGGGCGYITVPLYISLVYVHTDEYYEARTYDAGIQPHTHSIHACILVP